MGILGLGMAVAAGVVGTRIYDRVKAKNGEVNVNSFVDGAKEYAQEMVNNAPEALNKTVDTVMDKTIEAASKAKEKIATKETKEIEEKKNSEE